MGRYERIPTEGVCAGTYQPVDRSILLEHLVEYKWGKEYDGLD